MTVPEASIESKREQFQVVARKHRHRGPMVEVSYWTIRDAIRTSVLEPGESLIEVELAAELKMSRTPVREALRRLAVDHLIDPGPRRGYVVPTVSLNDFVELFEIREVLDGLAARHAALRMGVAEIAALEETINQHELAIVADDLPTIMSTSDTIHASIRAGAKQVRVPPLLMVITDAYRSAKGRQMAPERLLTAAKEHRNIFEAIKVRDPEMAEQLMREHVRSALRSQVLAYAHAGE